MSSLVSSLRKVRKESSADTPVHGVTVKCVTQTVGRGLGQGRCTPVQVRNAVTLWLGAGSNNLHYGEVLMS